MNVPAFKSRREAAGFFLVVVPIFVLVISAFALVDKLLQVFGRDIIARKRERNA